MIDISNEKELNVNIESLKKEILLAPTRREVELKERFFSVKTKEEIEEIFLTYDLEDLIDGIDNLISVEAKTFGLSNKALLKSPNGKELIDERDKITRVLKHIEKLAKRKKNLLTFYENMYKFLNTHLSYSEQKLDALIGLVDDLSFLTFKEKEIYISEIKNINEKKVKDSHNLIKQVEEAFYSKNITESDQTMVDIFEQKLSSMQDKKSEDSLKHENTIYFYIERYFKKSGEFFLGESYETLADLPSLGGMDSINKVIKENTKNGLTADSFAYIVLAILDIIKRYQKKEYYAVLDTLHERFMPYFEIQKMVQHIKNEIDSFSKKDQDAFYERISNIRILYMELETEFAYLNINECDNILRIIDEINKEISYIKTAKLTADSNFESSSYEERKGLVLFDCNSKNEVYVQSDLLGKENFIEKVAVERTPNYAEEYTSLIDNFVIKASEFIADDMSVESNREKLCTEISCKDKNGKVNRKNNTGIYRLRPNFNSNVRVAERKIVVPKDKKIYQQVMDIVKKHFSNYKYDNESDLIIFDIVGSAVKIYDETLYDEITDVRKRDLSIIRLFAKNGEYINGKGKVDFEVKDEFNETELALFEEYLKNTINTMRNLKNDNDRYDFDYLKEKPKFMRNEF